MINLLNKPEAGKKLTKLIKLGGFYKCSFEYRTSRGAFLLIAQMNYSNPNPPSAGFLLEQTKWHFFL